MNRFMAEALREAEKALCEGEVPVGAVIVKDGEIIARAHNIKEQTADPTAHAEMIAVRAAAKRLADWRLDGCDMYVTLEPCPMCASAILQARIKNLYFGCYDREIGAASNKTVELNWNGCSVYCGIDEESCGAILKEFFKNHR